jgi:hypothetical protein
MSISHISQTPDIGGDTLVLRHYACLSEIQILWDILYFIQQPYFVLFLTHFPFSLCSYQGVLALSTHLCSDTPHPVEYHWLPPRPSPSLHSHPHYIYLPWPGVWSAWVFTHKSVCAFPYFPNCLFSGMTWQHLVLISFRMSCVWI